MFLSMYVNKYVSGVLYILYNNLNNVIFMQNGIFFIRSQHRKRNLKVLSIKALKLFLLNVFQSSMKMDRPVSSY